jgi:hypothetical protein
MSHQSQVDEIADAVDAVGPEEFFTCITAAACQDIALYPGTVLDHVENFSSMPSAVALLMDCFFRTVSQLHPVTRQKHIINNLLANASFVQDLMPIYLRDFAPYLLPGKQQSDAMVALAADPLIRRSCVPWSCYLLEPGEWTAEIAAQAAVGCPLAAIPADFLTPELLASHTGFNELCQVALSQGPERRVALQFLQTHANEYFMTRPFMGDSLCLQFLPFVKGFIHPFKVTEILRTTKPGFANWFLFESFEGEVVLPENYAIIKLWPMDRIGLPPTDRYVRGGPVLQRFQALLGFMDWAVLPFFVKHSLPVDTMGQIASYLFIDGFASRVRTFFKNCESVEGSVVATYVARCIRPPPPPPQVKRVKLFFRF